jgi:hypothetical protein
MVKHFEPSLRPKGKSFNRLNASATDWSQFAVGDLVGVFLGNCWRKGEILLINEDFAIIKAKRLGINQPSQFNVYDSRNVVHAVDLTVTNEDQTLPLDL